MKYWYNDNTWICLKDKCGMRWATHEENIPSDSIFMKLRTGKTNGNTDQNSGYLWRSVDLKEAEWNFWVTGYILYSNLCVECTEICKNSSSWTPVTLLNVSYTSVKSKRAAARTINGHSNFMLFCRMYQQFLKEWFAVHSPPKRPRINQIEFFPIFRCASVYIFICTCNKELLITT